MLKQHAVFCLLCLLCTLGVAEFVWAGEAAFPPQEGSTSESERERVQALHEEQSAAETTETQKQEEEKQDFFSRIRTQIYRSVSSSARWFDSFFGETQSYQELDRSYGKIETHLFWDEEDGFEPWIRFYAKLFLPALENRWNLFLGRTNQQEFLEESTESLERVSRQARSLTDEEDWLLGLGFHPIRTQRRRFDVQAGLNMKVMPEPFVKIRYRSNVFLREKTLFRFRGTPFWEQEDGFGASTKIDFDHLLGECFLLRWANHGKFSETSEGLEWWIGLILYQNLTKQRAISYESWIRGATDAPITPKDYGAQVIYRQNLEGDWLYGELRGDVSWPKNEPEEVRKTVWGCGLGLELHFGENK